MSAGLMKWTAVHVLHWAVLYAAFVLQLDGAMNLLKFAVWVFVPLSLAFLSDRATEIGAEKRPAPVRGVLSWIQSWATLAALVWFGHTGTAAGWAFVMLMVGVHSNEVSKARKAGAA